MKMRVLILAALVVGSIPLAAQRSGRGRDAGPSAAGGALAMDVKPGAVRGTVVSSTGEPLRKAEVSLRATRGPGGGGGDPRMGGGPGPGSMSATTDSGGNFAFESVPPGSYVLSAQRAGYVRTDYSRTATAPGARSVPSVLEVASGGSLAAITLRMIPQAVVTGKVTDEDGDPVMHASVQVIRERWTNGRRQQMPMNADSTDDRGEYRIAGLVPGKYFLQVTSNRPVLMNELGQARPTSGGDQSYIPLFYPGVAEIGQAQALTLTPGTEARGIDFRMRKASTWRIRGQVLDEAGKPLQYAGVMALPVDGGMLGARSMGMVRGGEGKFEIAGLVPGMYTLVVNRAGRDEGRQTGRMTVSLGNRDLDNVVVQLQRPFDISGSVRVEGPDGRTVPDGALRVTLDPMESGLLFIAGGTDKAGNGQVAGDGTWMLSGVGPGKYRVMLSTLPAGMYLKGVFVGGQDISGGAQISAAATGIDIVLGPKAPEVSGTVIGPDKQPALSGTVFLVPDTARRDRPAAYKSTTVGDGGAFSLKNLAPGDYTAYALTEVEDGQWFDPDFLRTLEGKGVAVKLTEGQTETLQVPLAL